MSATVDILYKYAELLCRPSYTDARIWSETAGPSVLSYLLGFSRCPPKAKRIAESSLFWYSASPRELKRS